MNENTVTVEVALPGREYPIYIGPGVLDSLGTWLRERCSATRCTLITDSNVGPLYTQQARQALGTIDCEPLVVNVPAGDESKSIETVSAIYDLLAKRRHARDEPVIALGGGMVGDLAGFVAATWLRGVPFVQCPTTVEADVDASVGGKTAVNHRDGKNLIGAFHQPIFVCMDTDCLNTLTDRDLQAGLAESVKHAVIRDPAFLDWHERHASDILARQPDTLVELVQRNCRNKAEVVIADERETDDQGAGRAALNFGHTIGHAIETQANYELRHGEAVSLGMVAAMDLATRHCGFPEEERNRVERVLSSLSLPIRAPMKLDIPDILKRLGSDKKVQGSTVRFILPRKIGEVHWCSSLPDADIEAAVRRLVQV